MSDILSSPCWVKATELANPHFKRAYDHYVDERDQYGGWLMRQTLKINAEDFYVAVVSPDELPVFSPTGASAKALDKGKADAEKGEKAAEKGEAQTLSQPGFAYMAAVPFTVCPEVCDVEENQDDADAARRDEVEAAGSRKKPLYMVESAATALMDMVTSFHIILGAFPQTNGHVSLSIQTNHMGRMECGKTYLAISRIDKMGRRIVYTSVEFVEPQLTAVHDAAGRPLPMNTTTELLTAMKSATVLANVKHVKSMLSFS